MAKQKLTPHLWAHVPTSLNDWWEHPAPAPEATDPINLSKCLPKEVVTTAKGRCLTCWVCGCRVHYGNKIAFVPETGMRRHSGCDPNERYKSIYAAWEMHSHLSAIKAAIDFFDKLPEATLRAEKREHIRQWLEGKLQPVVNAEQPVYKDIPMEPPRDDHNIVIPEQLQRMGVLEMEKGYLS